VHSVSGLPRVVFQGMQRVRSRSKQPITQDLRMLTAPREVATRKLGAREAGNLAVHTDMLGERRVEQLAALVTRLARNQIRTPLPNIAPLPPSLASLRHSPHLPLSPFSPTPPHPCPRAPSATPSFLHLPRWPALTGYHRFLFWGLGSRV
jgi:hypothetical protein